jgi:hypothetical protein
VAVVVVDRLRKQAASQVEMAALELAVEHLPITLVVTEE